MPMMDKKIKAKWVKALRSGQYRKTKNRLASHKGDAFCCLGVLADVMGCEWTEGLEGLCPINPKTGRGQVSDIFLSVPLAQGLTIDMQSALSLLNDGDLGKNSKGMSLKKIGDWIAKNKEI